MNHLVQFLHASLILMTISCLHTTRSATSFTDNSDRRRNTIWPKYFDDELLPHLNDENFMPENVIDFIHVPETFDSTKPFGILDVLRPGSLDSRNKDKDYSTKDSDYLTKGVDYLTKGADYLSLVNKRTHDEETSFSTFTNNFGDLIRRRKSGGGNGFDALLKAARILDDLEDSRSFSPWAG